VPLAAQQRNDIRSLSDSRRRAVGLGPSPVGVERYAEGQATSIVIATSSTAPSWASWPSTA
jgi:hypothetical protein